MVEGLRKRCRLRTGAALRRRTVCRRLHRLRAALVCGAARNKRTARPASVVRCTAPWVLGVDACDIKLPDGTACKANPDCASTDRTTRRILPSHLLRSRRTPHRGRPSHRCPRPSIRIRRTAQSCSGHKIRTLGVRNKTIRHRRRFHHTARLRCYHQPSCRRWLSCRRHRESRRHLRPVRRAGPLTSPPLRKLHPNPGRRNRSCHNSRQRASRRC